MARADQSASSILHFVRNGANRPLHQDRQVLRAGDLALEQATQDAMLARARRYLHGWGVVAGFLPNVTDSNLLTIGPGYGVTPFGDELFLPESVSLPDAAETAVRSCGPGPLGCDIIDRDTLSAAREAIGGFTVTAWLIARTASRDAAPRPGVPEGCAHPATTPLPSRRCGGVEFAILCTLPPSHGPQALECAELMPFVCGLPRIGIQPLPWETPLGPEANFLVIAHLTVAGGALTAVVDSRRTLWPVTLIQDWIAACVCPAMRRTPGSDNLTGNPTGGEAPPPVGGKDLTSDPAAPVSTEDTTSSVTSSASETSPVIGGDVAPPPRAAVVPPAVVLDEQEAPPQDAEPELRDRLNSSVTDIAGVGSARARLLAAIGVTTEGEFLTTPLEQLAKVLNLPEAKVAEMKEEVSERHNLGRSFD